MPAAPWVARVAHPKHKVDGPFDDSPKRASAGHTTGRGAGQRGDGSRRPRASRCPASTARASRPWAPPCCAAVAAPWRARVLRAGRKWLLHQRGTESTPEQLSAARTVGDENVKSDVERCRDARDREAAGENVLFVYASKRRAIDGATCAGRPRTLRSPCKLELVAVDHLWPRTLEVPRANITFTWTTWQG